jgi:hypothetical protein
VSVPVSAQVPALVSVATKTSPDSKAAPALAIVEPSEEIAVLSPRKAGTAGVGVGEGDGAVARGRGRLAEKVAPGAVVGSQDRGAGAGGQRGDARHPGSEGGQRGSASAAAREMSGNPQSESPSKDVNTLICHCVPGAGNGWTNGTYCDIEHNLSLEK